MSSGMTRLAFLCAALAAAPAARAIDATFGDFQLKGVSKFTLGAGVRTQGRTSDALGVLNTPGQQSLCQFDDCLSFNGDPAPNRRLLDASGGHFLHAVDDGDMNYDKGDLYTGIAKLNADWTLNYGEWTFKTNFVAFFDEVNAGFETRRYNSVACSGANPSAVCTTADGNGFDHYNTGEQERPRLGEIEHRLAVRGEFREYFATRSFQLFDHEVFASLGNQRLRWGEANLTLLNTLDVINPQDAVLARQPGLALNELSLPVGLLTAGSDVAEGLTLDGWLQYKWEPVRPEPAGSFFSTNDVAGGGNYAVLGQGQYSEDPDALWFSQGSTGLISNSHRTIYVPDERSHAPSNFGQFGVRAKWYLPNFNNGTELGLYAANYHSRLPYLSVYAAQDSCLRDATNFNEAAVDCQGFNAASNRGQGAPLAPERCDPRGCNMGEYLKREPLPIDTMQLFLEYPENIHMFGVSFNTTLGGWSFAGEYSYRPNLPAQIALTDVVYAGLQPAIGRNSLPFVGLGAFVPDPSQPLTAVRVGELLHDFGAYATSPDGDPNAQNSELPSAREIFPDYLSTYRGYDNGTPASHPNDIKGGQYIAGYERLKTGQFALTALQLFSTNPFGSDDLLMVYEVGFTNVFDMPKKGELYFQGSGDTGHPSPGADGTGDPGGPAALAACDPSAPTQACKDSVGRVNPTQVLDGYADPFAWGVRSLIQLNYSNLFDIGLTVKPTVLAFYDVNGIAPSPQQNYVEGNRWIVPGLFFEYGSNISGTLLYQYFAGRYNLLGDRDNLSASFTYSF